MNHLINQAPQEPSLTMSGSEISSLTKTRHDSVKRTMETRKQKGIIHFSQSVENNGHAYHQTRFTPEGINWISKRLGLISGSVPS